MQPASFNVTARQPEVLYGPGLGTFLLQLVDAAIDQAQALDFSPHKGTIELVIIDQGHHFRVTGYLKVRFYHLSGKIRPAVKIQIHQQKSDIRRSIAIAETFIEFNAIEDVDAVVRHADVFQVDVAIAFPDKSLINPLAEEICVFIREPGNPCLDLLPFHNRKCLVFKGDHLFKVFLPVEHDTIKVAELSNGWGGGGVFVEIGNDTGHILHFHH